MPPRGMTVKLREGQRVGLLTVKERSANRIEGNAIRACWLCNCDCGNATVVTGHALSRALSGRGGTKSCGCLMRRKSGKHGQYNSRVYRIWHMMLQRCTNPKNPSYYRYGGRGITVCAAWKDFMAFHADMGTPLQTHTLDRIDNSAGYSKDNCRWVSMRVQGNNRSTNVFLSHNGKKQTLAQWARDLGITSMGLRGRLRSGWTIEKSLSTYKRA